MRLDVWKISGKLWCCIGFQKHELDENHLLQVINRPAESGLTGVVENKPILFQCIINVSF